MNQFAIAVTLVGLLCVSSDAAEPGSKKAGGKTSTSSLKGRFEKPDKGTFHATITAGERTQEMTSPSKAISALRRITSKRRRAKDVELEFKALINVNGGEYEFTKPADAQAALKAVAAAMARARKARIGFGEIGKIEKAEDAEKGESLKEIKAKAKEKQQKALSEQQKRFQAQRIVQFRIRQAFANEMQRSRGRPPNPLRLQQIVKAELDKAKAAGLISATADASSFNMNAADLARQSELESIRQLLGKAFRKANQKTEGAEEKEEKAAKQGAVEKKADEEKAGKKPGDE